MENYDLITKKWVWVLGHHNPVIPAVTYLLLQTTKSTTWPLTALILRLIGFCLFDEGELTIITTSQVSQRNDWRKERSAIWTWFCLCYQTCQCFTDATFFCVKMMLHVTSWRRDRNTIAVFPSSWQAFSKNESPETNCWQIPAVASLANRELLYKEKLYLWMLLVKLQAWAIFLWIGLPGPDLFFCNKLLSSFISGLNVRIICHQTLKRSIQAREICL